MNEPWDDKKVLEICGLPHKEKYMQDIDVTHINTISCMYNALCDNLLR